MALHESKELTRGDLIFFIASLRGILVDPNVEDWEKRRVMVGTSFDISPEDDEAYEIAKKRYFDSGDFAAGDEESPGEADRIIITQPIGACDGSGEYAYDPETEDGRGEKLAEPCPGCRACQ